MKQSSILYFALLAMATASTSVASVKYTSHSQIAFKRLQHWYNETSGLWNTCGWWNGANCMTAIADLAAVDSSILPRATRIFAHTYLQAPSVNPGSEVVKEAGPGFVRTIYGEPPTGMERKRAASDKSSEFLDSCFDDDGWWALAWIAAYDITGESCYLDTAEGIFSAMSSGGPTNCSNGGIYWCNDNSYVNAIANELYLSVAAHLACRVPSSANTYISIAQNQWTWFKNSGMINSDNLINDGLLANCSNNGASVWSYNQGVILGALVELNKVAPDDSYLPAAAAIASAAIANMTDANHVLREACEPDCAPDATQFKGIFIRNLLELHKVAPQDSYVQVITSSADSIWANDRNATNDLSVSWAGPFVTPANASTHSSALDALIAAIVVS